MLCNRTAQLELTGILHLPLPAESRMIISYTCKNRRKNGAVHPIASGIVRKSRELVRAGQLIQIHRREKINDEVMKY
jgi:hypothetical protein